MKATRPIAFLVLAALAPLSACEKKTDTGSVTGGAPAAPRADAGRTAPAPDNTANNRGDGTAATKSPLDQSQTGADVKVTAEIRRAIMDDKGMSINAQNCKIITDKAGVVTLRGVVNSQAEKDAIEAKAKAVVGVTRIDNQLEVKTS